MLYLSFVVICYSNLSSLYNSKIYKFHCKRSLSCTSEYSLSYWGERTLTERTIYVHRTTHESVAFHSDEHVSIFSSSTFTSTIHRKKIRAKDAKCNNKPVIGSRWFPWVDNMQKRTNCGQFVLCKCTYCGVAVVNGTTSNREHRWSICARIYYEYLEYVTTDEKWEWVSARKRERKNESITKDST